MDYKVYNLEFVCSPPPQFDENTLYVQKFAEDTVGTTFGASWVYVHNEKHRKKVALYKPLDYDEPLGAYAELFYSELAHLCSQNVKIRLPRINLVAENKDIGILSYSIVDQIAEDLIHIEALMFYKYKNKINEFRNCLTLGLAEILSAIRHEVHDEENFKEIEKAVIWSILLDAFTNNVDRHKKNWALVRNKLSNYYELATFDNVKSFINMFFHRAGYRKSDLWAISYNGTISSTNIQCGDQICEFIEKEYPEYFYEFISTLESVRKTFISSILPVKAVDSQRVSHILRQKIKCFETQNDEV